MPGSAKRSLVQNIVRQKKNEKKEERKENFKMGGWNVAVKGRLNHIG